jgi:hypothetical protein
VSDAAQGFNHGAEYPQSNTNIPVSSVDSDERLATSDPFASLLSPSPSQSTGNSEGRDDATKVDLKTFLMKSRLFRSV